MKKLIATLLVLVMVLALAACGSSAPAATDTPANTPAASEPATTEPAPAETTEDAAAPTEEAAPSRPTDDTPVVYLNGSAEALTGNVLLTSVGQSADFDTMSALLKKAGVEGVTADASATADTLGDANVLVVATGSSTKGLGAAGISTEDEMTRAKALLEACKSSGITVVLTHIGGEARRGSLSDQFIELVMDYAACMIVVDAGDADGLFSDYCSSNNIPLVLVKSMSNAVAPLSEILG